MRALGFYLWLSVISVTALGMAACTAFATAAASPSPAERARSEIAGLSAAEIFTCLGPPVKKERTDAASLWSYAYGACAVQLKVEDGRVKEAHYSAPHADDKTEDEQCENIPEVASCTRWLRR